MAGGVFHRVVKATDDGSSCAYLLYALKVYKFYLILVICIRIFLMKYIAKNLFTVQSF